MRNAAATSKMDRDDLQGPSATTPARTPEHRSSADVGRHTPRPARRWRGGRNRFSCLRVVGRSGGFIAAGDEILDQRLAGALAADRDGLVWWGQDTGGFRLLARGRDRIEPLPVPLSAEPLPTRLGTGAAGQRVATYARCGGGHCRGYVYDFRAGRERVLRRVRAPAHCAITAVAM